MSDTPQDRLWTRHSVEETKEIYARWAETYDRDITAWGYATPARIAAALRATGADPRAPVLDFGCGTGLSGMALKDAGFELIDGTDISPEMLAQAGSRGVYRSLRLGEPGSLGPVRSGDYAAIAAAGVVSLGAAPPETLDLLAGALAPGGLLAFSYNEATLADADYTGRLALILETPEIELAFEEDGPHLPEKNMRSVVYVLKRR